jgi:hypothetical protein
VAQSGTLRFESSKLRMSSQPGGWVVTAPACVPYRSRVWNVDLAFLHNQRAYIVVGSRDWGSRPRIQPGRQSGVAKANLTSAYSRAKPHVRVYELQGTHRRPTEQETQAIQLTRVGVTSGASARPLYVYANAVIRMATRPRIRSSRVRPRKDERPAAAGPFVSSCDAAISCNCTPRSTRLAPSSRSRSCRRRGRR